MFGMDSIEGRAAQLATFQELVLWTILATACMVMLAFGTYTGNSDIYDKMGQEMKTLSKTFLAVITSWRWAVEAYLRLAITMSKGEYPARHRQTVMA